MEVAVEEKEFEVVAIVAKTRGGNEVLDIKSDNDDELWDSLVCVQDEVFPADSIEGPIGIYRVYLTASDKKSDDEPEMMFRNYEIRVTVLLVSFVGLY